MILTFFEMIKYLKESTRRGKFFYRMHTWSTQFCIDVIRSIEVWFKIIVQGRFSKKITISFDYVENLLFPAIVSRVHSLELVYHLITSRVNVLTRYKSEA